MKFLSSLKKKLFGFFKWFKQASLKKKIFIILLVIIVGAIIASQFRSNKPNYNTAKAERADITQVVDESGAIKISSQTDIYSPTNGIIEELYVQNGDTVTKDQELFKVQSTATQQEQQAAYANYLTAINALNAAKSNLDLLQADMFTKWDTFKELAESDYYENSDGTPKYEQRALPEFHVPEKQWLAAEQKYKDQQQVIAQGQAQVNAAWLDYQSTQTAVVKATAAGTVSNLSVVLKDAVKANVASATSLTSMKPVLTVADYSVVGVLLSLNESDINKITTGDTATVDVDPIDNKKYQGVVRTVDDIGHDVNGVIKYNVFIQINNPDNQIKPGMTSDVEIITEKLTNVLSVPNSAVRPYEGSRAVQILNEKKEIEFIPVQTGIRGETRTQIIKGISEGQEIIVSLTNDQVKQSGLFGSQ